MGLADNRRRILELTAQVLGRCFIIGFGLLMVSIALYMLCGVWVYEIHSKWFSLSFERFGFVMYCGLAALKMAVFCFFGVPWLAIRLLLIKRG